MQRVLAENQRKKEAYVFGNTRTRNYILKIGHAHDHHANVGGKRQLTTLKSKQFKFHRPLIFLLTVQSAVLEQDAIQLAGERLQSDSWK